MPQKNQHVVDLKLGVVAWTVYLISAIFSPSILEILMMMIRLEIVVVQMTTTMIILNQWILILVMTMCLPLMMIMAMNLPMEMMKTKSERQCSMLLMQKKCVWRIESVTVRFSMDVIALNSLLSWNAMKLDFQLMK